MQTPGRRSAPVRIALVAGLLALAAALALTLSAAPVRLAGSNNVTVRGLLDSTDASGGRYCQDSELVPQGTASARLSLTSLDGGAGPGVSVTVLQAGRPIARGSRAAGWLGRFVAVPLAPAIRREVEDARVCFTFHAAGAALGAQLAETAPAGRLPGLVRIDYLRAGHESWWSFAPTIAARMGLGHAWSGISVALVVAALALVATALTLRLLLRELG